MLHLWTARCANILALDQTLWKRLVLYSVLRWPTALSVFRFRRGFKAASLLICAPNLTTIVGDQQFGEATM